jgi:putative transposase
MFRQLEYKCEWYGRTLVKIDRFFPSSKRCSHCGFVMDKLPLNVRSWDCPSCQTKGIGRDINAGKNILAAGLAVIVCGADIRPDNHSVKARQRGLGGFPAEAKPQIVVFDDWRRSSVAQRLSQEGQLRKTRKGRKQKLKS